jgi:hypothetical protein
MKRYITLEKLFEYEHTSKFNVSAETRGSLIKEIEGDDFHLSPIEWKILLNDIESILDKQRGKSLAEIENEFIKKTGTEFEEIIKEMFKELSDFISINPKIPDADKNFILSDRLDITTENSREEIIDLITKRQENSETALLTLYVYRQMDMIDWHPFVKASIERNPVSFTDLYEKNNYEVYSLLKEFPIDSIYDGNRLALPDEVWNFKRGDGIEQAFLLANFILHKDKSSSVSIIIDGKKVLLSSGVHDFQFISKKNLKKSIQIKGKEYNIG